MILALIGHGREAQQRERETEEIYVNHDQVSLLNCVLQDAAEGLSGADADLVMQIALALTRRDTKYTTLLTD